MMLKLNNEQTSIKAVALMIIIAYIFSVGMRFLWVNEFNSLPQFHWNNELMINTNDGYLFAEGARDILQGYHQKNDLSGVEWPIAQITALLAKILPFSFETIILYMPAFFGSLLVIPLVLIGRLFHQTTIGFISALIASVAHSYYNRTMAGYYDTDMLNIVLPMFVIYFLLLSIKNQKNIYLLSVGISISLYQWWYYQAYALDTAFLIAVLGYAFLYDKKNIFLYKIALFSLLGILAIPLYIKISLIIILFLLFTFIKNLPDHYFILISSVVIILYFLTGGTDPIWFFLKGYLFPTLKTTEFSLHYYDVMSTVRESGHINFAVFSERISGHTITFLFGFIGYIMAITTFRPLIISLPMLALGFIAMSSGLRFTIYAVPMIAFGFAFFLVWTTQFIVKKWLSRIFLATITLLSIYPNYLHIKEYMTPTVFTSQEVKSLEVLKNKVSPNDYVVAWWDYGYPIRYYSNVKTWIDGGQHSGYDNFPASFVLTSAQDPYSSAHLLRLFTEYTEKSYADVNNTKTKFEYMMGQEGFDDPDEFLTAISLPDYHLPKKTSEVYLYLPLRMMDILPTVTLFSNLDLKTGQKNKDPFFYVTQSIKDNGNTLDLNNGIFVLKDKNMLKIGNHEVPIKSFYEVGYKDNNILQKRQQHFSSEGLTVIYMASYGRFLIVDDLYFNSTYIQMFVLENYDKNLFEPVRLDPMTKIYKLKV